MFIIIFGVLTLPFFIIPDLDIILLKPFYNQATDCWYSLKIPFWDFIYKYGIYFGYLLVIISLIVLSMSYWKESLIKWRKPAFFMLFVMVMGPGVLVNGIFKEHWGRPRPRDIQQFNGPDKFVKVWVYNKTTNGKSFPSGHASMGFYVSIPFLFLRKRYKKWAWVFFILGTILGGLLGFARMSAGGHFTGDVIWAAGFVWLTGIVGYYLLKVNIEPVSAPAINKKSKRIAVIITGILFPVFTVGLLLATPYSSSGKFEKQHNELLSNNTKSTRINIIDGIVNVNFNKHYTVDYNVNAFGMINSKVRFILNDSTNIDLSFNYMGWFTEISNKINLTLPAIQDINNNLSVKNGKVFIHIPNDTVPAKLNVNMQNGNVTIIADSISKINLITSNKIINSNLLPQLISNKSHINISIAIENGNVVFQPKR
jgi:membrane-associated PAP2 superfamily phosphatase